MSGLRPKSTPRGNDVGDAIEAGNRGLVTPDRAPSLKAHAIGTVTEARGVRGDIAGLAGPACFILGGFTAPKDGGEGIFVWDSTATSVDDGGVTTIQANNAIVGRWRRAVWSGININVPVAVTAINVQVFLTAGSFTWTKPANFRRCKVWARGSDGGGGSGRRGASGTNRGGGGSGGTAAVTSREYYDVQLGATEPVVVGAAGLGGPAIGTNDTDGLSGLAGGNTTFSTGAIQLLAGGGGGGAPGTSASGAVGGTAGAASGGIAGDTAAGVTGSAGGPFPFAGIDGNATPNLSASSGGSGGGGAGITAGDVTETGALGGRGAAGVLATRPAAGAAGSPAGGAGGIGGAQFGNGGGGGGGSNPGGGGSGGNGGGGGGGGATVNGTPAAKGGDGGVGYAIVISECG